MRIPAPVGSLSRVAPFGAFIGGATARGLILGAPVSTLSGGDTVGTGVSSTTVEALATESSTAETPAAKPAAAVKAATAESSAVKATAAAKAATAAKAPGFRLSSDKESSQQTSD